MKIRPVYGISIVAIVLLLCAIVWFALQPREMEPVVAYKMVTPEPRPTEPLTREQRIQAAKEERKQTLEVRAAAAKERRLASMRERRDTAEEIQAMRKALDSPEYLEYRRKQDAVFPGYNIALWWDFLESQGIEAGGRKLQQKQFREVFPTGDYLDYEPEMQKKLAALFLEYPPDDVFDLADEQEAHAYTRGIVDLFMNTDWKNKIWMRGYFNGYDGHLSWAENVRQNASRIVAADTPAATGVDKTSLPTHSTFNREPSTAESTKMSVEALTPEHEALPPFEDIEKSLQTVEAREREFPTDIFTDTPNLSTNADFEKALRDAFSPKRFNTALQTLNRYGPEEGLRRLKTSDLEVATYIERLIPLNKEND